MLFCNSDIISLHTHTSFTKVPHEDKMKFKREVAAGDVLQGIPPLLGPKLPNGAILVDEVKFKTRSTIAAEYRNIIYLKTIKAWRKEKRQ